MQQKTVCLVGGTGFVGSHLARDLVHAGHRVKILTRHRERHRELLVTPGVELVEADPFDTGSLRATLQGADAVVNLVGVLNASGEWGFERAHAFLPGILVSMCKKLGIPRLLHMSALNAGLPGNNSVYLRTKGQGERKVLAEESAGLHVTCFRPSVIFGPGDSFINRFAGLLRMSPVLTLPCPTSRFAPVYVADVTAAMVAALDDPETYGKSYDLCGPKVYTLRQIVDYTAKVMGLRRTVWGLGPTASQWQAWFMQWVPGKPFSPDNYRSLQSDSVCRPGYSFPFDIAPTPLEAVVPLYLGKIDPRRRYMDYRAQARR